MDDTALIKALLTEMFSRVGLEFDIEFCKQEDWYRKHTWTVVEELDFIDWGVNFLAKRGHRNKAYARKEMSWFLLAYGWMVEDR